MGMRPIGAKKSQWKYSRKRKKARLSFKDLKGKKLLENRS